jgi:DedD protein
MATMGDGIRNIERIEEHDDAPRMPRGVTLAFVVLGGACVLFAALALSGRTSRLPEKRSDPLGDLLAQSPRSPGAPAGPPAARDLSAKDVTFPQMLSDGNHPSTALAAVRAAAPGASPDTAGATPPAAAAAQPPPPTDRLSVVPLPAQAVLEATPLVTHPRDAMTKAASDAARISLPPSSNGGTPAGHGGGYQLQVSSFHTLGEAQTFAEQLRARGHKAYAVEANVPGRGTWYRVRIGPFATQHEAAAYRVDFEDKEHVVPFIVTPETTAKIH